MAMDDLLDAIRDRLVTKQGRPKDLPDLDARRVFIVHRGERPASPPYPHVLLYDAGSPVDRHMSRQKEIHDMVNIEVLTKINLPRGAHVVGSASPDRYYPANSAIFIAGQIEDLLDDWPVVDSDGNSLSYDVSEYLDRTESVPVDEERVATSSVTLHFRFIRFEIHTQPT